MTGVSESITEGHCFLDSLSPDREQNLSLPSAVILAPAHLE